MVGRCSNYRGLVWRCNWVIYFIYGKKGGKMRELQIFESRSVWYEKNMSKSNCSCDCDSPGCWFPFSLAAIAGGTAGALIS